MHCIIVLCFVILAAAAPQGYNYLRQQPLTDIASLSFDNKDAEGNQQQPLISKQFIFHAAPEEEDVEIQQKDIVVGQPRKNYNVVFIRAPAASAQKTRIRVIPSVNEENTSIYVLAKNAGENEIFADVVETAVPTSKPEIHFIKYNTNEEAEQAQRTIQASFDHLGGSTNIVNENIGQVSSVVGSLNDPDAKYQNSAVVSASDYGVETGSENVAYLPTVNKH